MNGLYEMRKDLKIIMEEMSGMNYRNCYDKRDVKRFYGDKDEAINEGCEIIKSEIIRLANKYKETK